MIEQIVDVQRPARDDIADAARTGFPFSIRTWVARYPTSSGQRSIGSGGRTACAWPTEVHVRVALTQFLYAEGAPDTVRAVFSMHDVVVTGCGLDALLADVAAQAVTVIRQPPRARELPACARVEDRGGGSPRD